MNLVLELRPPESRLYGSWEERLATVSRFVSVCSTSGIWILTSFS